MMLGQAIQSATLLNRSALRQRYAANRQRTAMLFALVREAMYERPLPRRMPFIFYAGHIPAFSWLTLRKACGLAPIDAELEELFDRGIDPDSDEEAARLQPRTWPSIAAVNAFSSAIDAAVDAHLKTGILVDDEVPMLVAGQAIFAMLEHEEMHQETLTYLLSCLDPAKKTLTSATRPISGAVSATPQRCYIPAGRATIGTTHAAQQFAWDNELLQTTVAVPAFSVESLPVSNRAFLAYVNAGGTVPEHWIHAKDGWRLRTPLAEIDLPLDWPAYVSPQLAAAFARDHRARLMTEAEYHRAAFGRPDGTESRYAWGDAAPQHSHGNFDFQSLTPENIGSRPAGRSAFGVDELCGNGWEITATPFAPLAGFTPLASYPQYSSDFFDGRHYVVKGASPVTARTLLRRSLRNWFYHDYPYAFLKFRLAFDA